MAEASRLSLCASLWASSSVGSGMITGIVTASREAIITLHIARPDPKPPHPTSRGWLHEKPWLLIILILHYFNRLLAELAGTPKARSCPYCFS